MQSDLTLCVNECSKIQGNQPRPAEASASYLIAQPESPRKARPLDWRTDRYLTGQSATGRESIVTEGLNLGLLERVTVERTLCLASTRQYSNPTLEGAAAVSGELPSDSPCAQQVTPVSARLELGLMPMRDIPFRMSSRVRNCEAHPIHKIFEKGAVRSMQQVANGNSPISQSSSYGNLGHMERRRSCQSASYSHPTAVSGNPTRPDRPTHIARLRPCAFRLRTRAIHARSARSPASAGTALRTLSFDTLNGV